MISRIRKGLTVLPFSGTPEEQETNEATHHWMTVLSPLRNTPIPEDWKKLVGLTRDLPEFEEKCASCNAWRLRGEERKYPCGQTETY